MAYLDTAWQQFKMGGVMSAKFIRYPDKDNRNNEPVLQAITLKQ